jgi:hypothetical protein
MALPFYTADGSVIEDVMVAWVGESSVSVG